HLPPLAGCISLIQFVPNQNNLCMKTSLLTYSTIILLFSAWNFAPLKANPQLASTQVSLECSTLAAELITPNLDNPCYPTDWVNTYNITQTSATWQWGSCYGASSYSVQWRYP